jgi:hypothetical protein
VTDALTGLGIVLIGVALGLKVGLWSALLAVGIILLGLGLVAAHRERPKPAGPSERMS